MLNELLDSLRNPVERLSINGRDVVVKPDNYNVEDLDLYSEVPARVKRKPTFTDMASLAAYVRRFNDAATAYIGEQKIQVVLDHSEPGFPDWHDHVASYLFPLSREWEAWNGSDKVKKDQIAFAEFLEDHVTDVVEPSGADLMEMILKFKVVKKSVFGSSATLSNGEFSIEYSNENEKGSLELPAEIRLGIPVFKSGDPYKVTARFKHRVHDGKLTIWYELVNPQAIRDDALETLAQEFRDDLPNVQVYRGSQ